MPFERCQIENRTAATRAAVTGGAVEVARLVKDQAAVGDNLRRFRFENCREYSLSNPGLRASTENCAAAISEPPPLVVP